MSVLRFQEDEFETHRHKTLMNIKCNQAANNNLLLSFNELQRTGIQIDGAWRHGPSLKAPRRRTRTDAAAPTA
jgi:hypothetical protein